jgi:hypothetical protein
MLLGGLVVCDDIADSLTIFFVSVQGVSDDFLFLCRVLFEEYRC